MKKSDFIRVFLPLFIIVGAIFCLDNGVVVHKLPDLQNEPDSIILFHVISLFTFGAKDFGEPEAGPWFLQMLMFSFYFLAPMVTIVAMADILSLIRPMFIKWVMWRKKYHVVIGYGRIGKSALEAINTVHGKKSFVLVLDKLNDESENGFSILFEHNIFFKKDVGNLDDWSEFITKQCQGVYILTDDELLNLRIYHKVKTLCHDQAVMYTRIRSMELSLKLDNSSLVQKHNFVNIHMATPDLMFQTDAALKDLDTNDPIYNHFKGQRTTFNTWLGYEYAAMVFVGFGTFSEYLLSRLLSSNLVPDQTELIVLDPKGQNNWNGFLVDHPELQGLKVSFYNKDIMVLEEVFQAKAHLLKDQKCLCFFATNHEIENIQMASYIKRKYATVFDLHSVLRTKHYDLMPTELLNDILGSGQYVVVPTYSWAKLDFELILLG